jgi:hypothetical protein
MPILVTFGHHWRPNLGTKPNSTSQIPWWPNFLITIKRLARIVDVRPLDGDQKVIRLPLDHYVTWWPKVIEIGSIVIRHVVVKILVAFGRWLYNWPIGDWIFFLLSSFRNGNQIFRCQLSRQLVGNPKIQSPYDKFDSQMWLVHGSAIEWRSNSFNSQIL